MPFDDEADAVAQGQRHGVRPVGVDLDPRRRARAAGRPRRRGREPLGQLAQQRALLDAVRRLQAVRARPRARTRRARRVHRRQERLHLHGLSPAGARREGWTWQAGSSGKVAVVTGGCSGIGLATVRRFAQEGARSSSATSTTPAGRGVAAEVGGAFVHCDVDRHGGGRRDCSARPRRRYGSVDIAFNNAGISPPDDDSILDTGPRRLAPGPGGQPHQRLPVLQGGPAVHARAGQGLDHQHGVVRRRDGRRHVADLLHREQGRGAVDVPRARRAVRPRGRAGQRAVPRPGQHPAAAGAVRQGPRAGRAPAGARPDGPVRRARGDGQRRAVPAPATSPASSPPRPSWSTAASRGAYVTPL